MEFDTNAALNFRRRRLGGRLRSSKSSRKKKPRSAKSRQFWSPADHATRDDTRKLFSEDSFSRKRRATFLPQYMPRLHNETDSLHAWIHVINLGRDETKWSSAELILLIRLLWDGRERAPSNFRSSKTRNFVGHVGIHPFPLISSPPLSSCRSEIVFPSASIGRAIIAAIKSERPLGWAECYWPSTGYFRPKAQSCIEQSRHSGRRVVLSIYGRRTVANSRIKRPLVAHTDEVEVG